MLLRASCTFSGGSTWTLRADIFSAEEQQVQEQEEKLRTAERSPEEAAGAAKESQRFPLFVQTKKNTFNDV